MNQQIEKRLTTLKCEIANLEHALMHFDKDYVQVSLKYLEQDIQALKKLIETLTH